MPSTLLTPHHIPAINFYPLLVNYTFYTLRWYTKKKIVYKSVYLSSLVVYFALLTNDMQAKNTHRRVQKKTLSLNFWAGNVRRTKRIYYFFYIISTINFKKNKVKQGINFLTGVVLLVFIEKLKFLIKNSCKSRIDGGI